MLIPLLLLKTALGANPGVEVHGPVEQGVFLLGMGIRGESGDVDEGFGE
jgi:hypothetical protein